MSFRFKHHLIHTVSHGIRTPSTNARRARNWIFRYHVLSAFCQLCIPKLIMRLSLSPPPGTIESRNVFRIVCASVSNFNHYAYRLKLLGAIRRGRRTKRRGSITPHRFDLLLKQTQPPCASLSSLSSLCFLLQPMQLYVPNSFRLNPDAGNSTQSATFFIRAVTIWSACGLTCVEYVPLRTIIS
jgi:hypothetical protein